MEELLQFCMPLIAKAEDYRQFPYPDTTGHLTVGYGHNLNMKGISRAIADLILKEDIEEAIAGCVKEIPFLHELNEARQYVLVNMAFNMGIGGLCSFKKMLAALQEARYQDAAQEIANSLEAKQVPSRIFPLIKIIETGAFPNNDDAAKAG